MDFETLLNENRAAVERFVRFRIASAADADDVLQDVYVAACQKLPQLKNTEAFKPWLLSIARNKCNDFFRKKARRQGVALDELPEKLLADSRFGHSEDFAVGEALDSLGGKDKQILRLYFWKSLPQAEIAARLGVPLGTVKSRLHTAKRNFKATYQRQQKPSFKGEAKMKKLPEFLPDYKIEALALAPFCVLWEELVGWFLVPKLGESLSWAMYDIPSRKCSHVYDMRVVGKAKVHGIEGVELTAREAPYSRKSEAVNRTFVAQLTDTHCRYLAAVRNDGGIRNFITFLDGDEFLQNWGFGADNIGNETRLAPKGDIRRNGSVVASADKDFLLDIVGRYTVTIGGKRFDTVCVMDIETYNSGVVSEQFLDKNGRTVLWRRFNRDDWALGRYKTRWSERLPQNERLTINGASYVHWYDCITDYVL